MNLEALFSDGTSAYVIPAEPMENDTVTLRFRTAKDDVDKVLITIQAERAEEEVMPNAGQPGCYEMKKDCSNDMFDYYEFEYVLGTVPVSYQFEAWSGDENVYYNSCGVVNQVDEQHSFKIVPGFSTPTWAKGAVMYQILVDRFYNGDRKSVV